MSVEKYPEYRRCIILMGWLTPFVWATTDEGVFGRYVYNSPKFSISFEWTPDVLHELVIQGVHYRKDIKLDPNGLNGMMYSYDAALPQAKGSHISRLIHFEAYVSEDKVIYIVGTYLELSHNDIDAPEQLKRREIFTPRLVRLKH